MDSANPEPGRGRLPDLARLAAFRTGAAASVHARIGAIRDGLASFLAAVAGDG